MMRTKLFAMAWLLLFVAFCFSANNTPWDGSEWDSDSPDIDQPLGNAYKELYSIRRGVETRINKEHVDFDTSSVGGEHLQGSARAFFQDAAPTTQIDGTAWVAGDTGSLWFDTNSTPDNLVYVLTDHTSTGTWTLLSVSMTAEIVAAAHQWADVQTFDVEAIFTLGLTSNAAITLGAGDDLIGSATSAINMNNFDVDEAGVATLGASLDIAGTVVVVGTIDDDTMGTATDTTVATSESIVAYVDASTLVNAGAAKCYGNFSSGASLRAGSFNVTSVSAGATGTYTITWDTDFANSTYTVGLTAGQSNRVIWVDSQTAGACVVKLTNIANDAATGEIFFIAHGSQ